MKRIISICLVIMLVFSAIFTLNGCAKKVEINEENIKAAVETVETALKEFDTKTLEKYVDSPTLNVILPYAKEKTQFTELGQAMFESLEIEIKSIDAANKTVTIAAKNKDLYMDASNFAYDLKNNYSSMQLLSLVKDDDFLNSNLGPLVEKIKNASMKEEAIEATLTVTNGSKGNLVLTFDEEAEDAVSGGALSAIKKVFEA